jgi:hypothetical protein
MCRLPPLNAFAAPSRAERPGGSSSPPGRAPSPRASFPGGGRSPTELPRQHALGPSGDEARRSSTTVRRGGQRAVALGGEVSEPTTLGDACSSLATTRRGEADNRRRRSAGREADHARWGGGEPNDGEVGSTWREAAGQDCFLPWLLEIAIFGLETHPLGRSQIPGMGTLLGSIVFF